MAPRSYSQIGNGNIMISPYDKESQELVYNRSIKFQEQKDKKLDE